MKIDIEPRHEFGELRYYPLCNNAKLFAHIANTVTLTSEALWAINEMGVEIHEMLPTRAFDRCRRQVK